MVRKDFQRKKVESLTLGEQLVELRKNRQVSIAEFSKHTKIQRKYVEALESGRYGDLPSPVYIKGFLHAYEQYFGVAERSLVRVFEREHLIYKNIHEHDQGAQDVLSRKTRYLPRFVITPRMMVIVFVVTGIFGILGYVYYGVDKFVSAPWVIVENPMHNATISASQVTVRGTTHPEARVFLNEKPIVVLEDGRFEEEIGLVPGDNTITVKSVNKSGKETVEKIMIIADFERAVLEEVVAPQDGVHVEFVTTDAPSWLSVTADEIEVFSGIMEENTTKKYDAQKEIRVTAGVANAVQVILNGEDQGLLGDTTDMAKDIIFDAKQDQEDEQQDDSDDSNEEETDVQNDDAG